MLADNIHCLRLSLGCGYDYRIRQQAAFIIGCFTSLGSHKHVPPNSVLTAQMSWFADTALYFSESDRVLQFPHRSYQRSSRVERLCVFLPASCGLRQRSALHSILFRLRKRSILLYPPQRNLHRYKADFPLSVSGRKS